jgi:cyanophycinase
VTTGAKGTLIVIGGHEEKARDGDREVLTMVAAHATKKKGPLLIVTAATNLPAEVAAEYTAVFHDLGVDQVDVLDVRTREEAQQPEAVAKVAHASVVFFTGGDQLRITSQLGDSPVYQCMQETYHKGTTIAGTSAGAAAMPDTMLVSGPGDESNQISAIGMAPGLGLVHGMVIDSHFAERGRFGRLLGAVSQNPRNLGVGIDENTAIVLRGREFGVIGTGAVYVMDGASITYSSLSERHPTGVVSIYDVRLHVLARHDAFDLERRRPILAEETAKETG